MAKNIRITKANQIAINHVAKSNSELDRYSRWIDEAKEEGDEKLLNTWKESYTWALKKWSAQTDMLAAMNNLDFCDMVKSKNYHEMLRIAEANL